MTVSAPDFHLAEKSSVDLNSCDREPIHLAGAVQGFGFLLAVTSEWVVRQASENIGRFLPVSAADVLGQPAEHAISPDALHTIRNKLQGLRSSNDVERIFALELQPGSARFDVALHLSGGLVVIECEPSVSEPDLNSGGLVRSMVNRLSQAEAFASFTREATRQVRMLSGFDRVMIYRFSHDGAGEVIAESTQAGLTPFMGLHYPASDIPKQARALYERSWLRQITDVSAAIHPVLTALDEDNTLDMSLCQLRTVSPIHVEYLRNMGVAASMSISILRGGKLWGLIACHHNTPRYLSFERRTALELFGQMFSLLLESREREAEIEQEARGRLMQNTLMSAIASEDASLESLSRFFEDFTSSLKCEGVGIWLDGKCQMYGRTPTAEEFLGVVRYLDAHQGQSLFATHEIGAHYLPAKDFVERAAGMLAVPISRVPRDYIVFFRQEIVETIKWAGDPSKPVETGPNGIRLTPRKSFEAWSETVRGQSHPWSDVEQRIAESLRIILLEVVLRLTDRADSERKSSQQKQELLIAELNHRVRNILSLVKGLLAQTSPSGSVQEYAEVVSGRIQALARAHDQITSDDWQPASLRGLIRAEGEAYLAGKADRIKITGDEVLIAPQAFSTVALVIHEMMTNSAKYGALCDRAGWISIKWHRDPLDRLVIEWTEQGGPPVQPPTRRGFGSTIIERSIPFDLQGEASIDYELDGVKARFVLPGNLVLAGKAPAPEVHAAAPETGMLELNGTLLLVEDNIIIAMDAEDALREIGLSRIVVQGTVADTLRYLQKERPIAALIDFNLGRETSVPVAERLAELSIPFFFATGYGEGLKLPEALNKRPVVKKPYNIQSLRAALSTVLTEP